MLATGKRVLRPTATRTEFGGNTKRLGRTRIAMKHRRYINRTALPRLDSGLQAKALPPYRGARRAGGKNYAERFIVACSFPRTSTIAVRDAGSSCLCACAVVVMAMQK